MYALVLSPKFLIIKDVAHTCNIEVCIIYIYSSFCKTTMGLVTNFLLFILAQNFYDCMKIINDFYLSVEVDLLLEIQEVCSYSCQLMV